MNQAAFSGKTVLVTGANGYIGSAVARAFSRAGWLTYGLVRHADSARTLARDEIQPVLGTPEDLSFLDRVSGIPFDVVVSNTDDFRNPERHFEKVGIMLEEVGRHSTRAGMKPLVMCSSGCKDYGVMAENDGDPDLTPHIETSPINPPNFVAARTAFGLSLLTKPSGAFDVTVLRPTNVYGLTASVYGTLFDLAADSQSVLTILGNPNAIMHALHVDDCGEGYVALAEHRRADVVGQAFNLSNARYDTARGIGEALARSYGLKLEFRPAPADVTPASAHGLANFSQWVSSEKLRALTGWSERKPSFSDGIELYRIAYEAAKRAERFAPL